MDTVKVAKDYFLSSQSSLLIPKSDYGSRKLVNVTGLPKAPANLPSLPSLPRPPGPFRSLSERTQGKGKYLPKSESDSNLLRLHQRQERSASLGGSSVWESDGSDEPQHQEDRRPTPSHVMKSSTKQWIHPPDLLLKGQITYNVKFLGECNVDQPKGTEVVKDAIRKMKFNKHLKRAEGQKPPKVQLTIAVDGVGIQDPKSKMILHQYPLHRISYCADDKSDKKMFTFIAKAATTNDHYCYVFNCSDKSAEEITLTVGQAFDLAYKRFLEEGSNGAGSETDYKKQCLLLQRRVNSLQFENDALKKRVLELDKLKDRSDLEEYMKNNKIDSLTTVMYSLRDNTFDDEHGEETSDDFEFEPTTQPSGQQSMVGRRLENLVFDPEPTQSNGNSSSSAAQSPTPLLSPPPPSTRHHRSPAPGITSPGHMTASQPSRQQSPGDPFSSNPFGGAGPAGAASDPFGMGAFNPAQQAAFSPNTNGAAAFGGPSQQELMDIQAGFSRGLSFGTDDFNLDDLDPLNHRL